MFTSADLKSIITEARPFVERMLDDAEIIAGFRTTVTEKGGDWGQVKALVKAMIQDERDDAGGHTRVTALLAKADHVTGYADMLGLGNLNEKNSFAGDKSWGTDTGARHPNEPEPPAQKIDTATLGAADGVDTKFPVVVEGSGPTGVTDVGDDGDTSHPAQEGGSSESLDMAATPAAGEAGALPVSSAEPTHFLNSKGLKRLIGCTDPEDCAGSTKALCWGCTHHLPITPGGAAIEHQGPVS